MLQELAHSFAKRTNSLRNRIVESFVVFFGFCEEYLSFPAKFGFLEQKKALREVCYD